MKRWPLQPLLDATGLSMRRLKDVVKGDPYPAKTVGLSDDQADRWAVSCGLLPHEVWPDWFDAALTPLDRQFVFGGGWRPAWLYDEARRAHGRMGQAA